jgi:hypothetical protein
MSNWKLGLSSVTGPIPSFLLSYLFIQSRPVLGFLFAALGCLLFGSSAWVMSDRIRASETPIAPDNIAGPLLTSFAYLMFGGSVAIVVVAVLQGFGAINWTVRL